jgi:tetratricopeptide (TPR) repeat protein
MRPWIWVTLLALCLIDMAAGAPERSYQDGQSAEPQSSTTTPSDTTPPPDLTTPATSTPSLTVTGQKPLNEPPLPKLPPDQFTNCYSKFNTDPESHMDIAAMTVCQLQLARDERIVIDKCVNRDRKNSPPLAVQACTELLDRNLLQGRERFYLLVNRALAFVAQGDKEHALEDFNAAVKTAPKMAQPYYFRGAFYAQNDVDAALKDFDMALSIDPKLISALRQRAILHLTQKNFSSALADYSEAVRLKPKTATLWSERGYVSILDRDYASAVKDEAEAIRIDPKLARAYFLRGAALGDLGDSANAVNDIRTAVDLDPCLDRYISTQGKTASIVLPPL